MKHRVSIQLRLDFLVSSNPPLIDGVGLLALFVLNRVDIEQ